MVELEEVHEEVKDSAEILEVGGKYFVAEISYNGFEVAEQGKSRASALYFLAEKIHFKIRKREERESRRENLEESAKRNREMIEMFLDFMEDDK